MVWHAEASANDFQLQRETGLSYTLIFSTHPPSNCFDFDYFLFIPLIKLGVKMLLSLFLVVLGEMMR